MVGKRLLRVYKTVYINKSVPVYPKQNVRRRSPH